MARIFLSHSSSNNAQAIALRDWLVAEGWDDLFLDLDPDRGIVAGERWERALHEAANRCEAVIFLVSDAWLGSEWCHEELQLARRLNKRMFGVMVESLDIKRIPAVLTAHWQLVDLASGNDHGKSLPVSLPDGSERHISFSRSGLRRLKAGLTKAGLDPRFFAWPPDSDPDRPAYRGMRPFEADDAGIFFGRDAPIVEALDRLRGLAEGAPPRLMAILGASGAGKSSFLRAGLLPRLSRDDRNFLVLPVVRPERSVIEGETGLVASLMAALKTHGVLRPRSEILAAVESGGGGVLPILRELADAARAPRLGEDEAPPAPALVLALDQGEELFVTEGDRESRMFLSLLAELLLAAAPRMVVLVTIRSDSYERLQTAPALDGIRQTTQSLPPLPKGAYQTIIEGPPQRLKDSARALTIEPALTEKLLADVEEGGGKDALPLLAFTLERLYLERPGSPSLTLDDYERLGGIRGSIDAAVERALKRAVADPSLPTTREAILALVRRALIPWLAGIDPETGSPRRRVARLAEIPEEARPLIAHLVAERLLATEQAFAGGDGTESTSLVKQGEATVEPAHEALLRQWGLLQGWLEEDRAELSILSGIKRAVLDWEANARNEEWLSHAGGRLEDAEALKQRADLSHFLDAADRAYLDAARAAETRRRDRDLEEARKLAEAQQKVVRRTRLGALAAGLLAIAAAAAAWYGFDQARLASAKNQEAELGSARLSISVAQQLYNEGQVEEASLMLLDAARYFTEETAPDQLRIALNDTVESATVREFVELPAGVDAVETMDGLYFIDNTARDVLRLDGKGVLSTVLDGEEGDAAIRMVGVNATSGALIVLRQTLDIEIVEDGRPRRVARFAPPAEIQDRTFDRESIVIDPSGMVVWSQDFSDTSGKSGTYLQFADTGSGATFSSTLDEFLLYAGSLRDAFLTASDGTQFVAGYDAFHRLVVDGNRIGLEPATPSPGEMREMRVRTCFMNGLSSAGTSNPYILEGDDDYPSFDKRCLSFGDATIVSTSRSTSAGVDRTDEIVDSTGEAVSIGNLIDNVSDYGVPTANISWLGADAGRDAIAAIVNRDLFVFNRSALMLQQKHADAPGPARFLDDGKLAVVDARGNRVLIYGYEAPLYRASTSDPTEGAILAGTATLDARHFGTCTGHGIPNEQILATALLPDGATIERGQEPEVDYKPGAHFLRIMSGGRETRLQLGMIDDCYTIAPDWKHMLVRRSYDAQTEIVDFEKFRQTGDLEASVRERLPEIVFSSFFAGPGIDILTADGRHSVRRWRLGEDGAWRSEVVYEGDNPVIYAEPDEDARKIIILESLGAGDVEGWLHSTEARAPWLYLGRDYKWLGAAFSRDGAVAFGARTIGRVVKLASLAQLVSETDAALPARCRPPAGGTYRDSACWPKHLK